MEIIKHSEERSPKINKKHDSLIVSNFTKRLKKEFEELDVEGKGCIDYLTFGELMQNIGCITEFNEAKSPNKLRELWEYLGGGESEVVGYDDIFKTLAEILLIPVTGIKTGNKLHKEFYDFFTTYSVTGKGKSLLKKSPTEKYSFHPQLCKKSQEIFTKKYSPLTKSQQDKVTLKYSIFVKIIEGDK